MALVPAVTDLDQLKGHPAISRLLSWNPKVVEGVKFDRDEMTIYVDRPAIRESGLWNVNHVYDEFRPAALDILESRIRAM